VWTRTGLRVALEPERGHVRTADTLDGSVEQRPVCDLDVVREGFAVHGETVVNHGFAVDSESLPNNVEVTHRSLFDGTVQGVRCTDMPAFGFQGHPEASPGPHDCGYLFDRFVAMMGLADDA